MLRRVSTGALRSAPTLRARLQQQAAAHAATATAAPVPSGANKSNVKIVATIGPASEHMPKLQHVVDAGLKIMRINFSHATYEEADLRTTNLRLCTDPLTAASGAAGADRPNLRGIMLDTQGPEIRTGQFPDGGEISLSAGSRVVVTVDEAFRTKQSKDKIWITYKDFPLSTHPGASILIEDGILELRVLQVLSGTDVECEVVNAATLGNKKNVNLPGQKITLPAISDKDKQDLIWGVKNDVDYIAASFIRKPEDVLEIQAFLDSQLALHQPKGHPRPLIISKIESTEGLHNFNRILDVSDGIMVARGDLGVEIPQEALVIVQKEIVRRTHAVGKPVVVATQMLDSMQKNPRPTRAESTDVSNAMFDGADCVMLSGESAKGKYPVQSVATMKRIVDEAQRYAGGREVNVFMGPERLKQDRNTQRLAHIKPNGPRESIAQAAVEMSELTHAACIIVASESGKTARSVSKFRPTAPVLCLVKNAKLARLLQINYALHPVVADVTSMSSEERERRVVSLAKSLGFCKAGDKVVLVEGKQKSAELGSGTSLKIANVI